jgi:hypothetical protein
MRRTFFLFAVLLISRGNPYAQQPVMPGTVIGHVFCADTQTVCRFASVTIESAIVAGEVKPSADESHSYSAATDVEGAFQIGGVAQGEYYIQGGLAGYVSPYDLASSIIQNNPGLSSKALDIALTKIVVVSGRATISNLTLSRGASLGGTVRYDDGAPAIHLAVHLFRKDDAGVFKPYINTLYNSVNVPPDDSTDDRGRFYSSGLPPGEYAVEVSLPEVVLLPTAIVGRHSLSGQTARGDALNVFSGGKYRLRDAASIKLGDGEDRSDVDISIPTSGMHTVRGYVTEKSDGAPIYEAMIRLLDPVDKTELRQTSTVEDGSFAFKYVVNGPYILEVVHHPKYGKGESSTNFTTVTMPLQIDRDLPDLNIALVPAAQ